MAFVVIASISCDSSQQPGSNAALREGARSDGVPAEQILASMKSVYANAKTYQDQGQLLLSYRKDGLLTEEPQRWSTAWTREGLFAAELFGGQLTGDGQRLDCFIYDIDTANLDGQRLVVPYTDGQPPITKVINDPIGSVFLCGYSELPLNESDAKLQRKLVPATIGLLTGQLGCPWVDAPDRVERLGDQELDGTPCYVVRSLALQVTCDLWIDQQSGLLRQMSLPLVLLDPQVMAARNINDLQLLARFENAVVDGFIDPEKFQVKMRKNSTPVAKFVSLPEALPVESIGQTADGLRLTQLDRQVVDHLHFDGKPTALLWLGGDNSYAAIGQLDSLANGWPTTELNLGIIYSDTELTGSPAQPHLIRPELTAATAGLNIPLYHDPGLSASTALAIRTIPSVVLLDGDSRVQFAAATVGNAWPGDLSAAIERVRNGDDLATDMLTQYQEYMTRYKNALLEVDAMAVLPERLRVSEARTGGRATESGLPKRDTRSSIRLRRVWSSRAFKQPGNILTIGGANPEIVVLDGSRTIVELDLAGRMLDRRELALPQGVGVGRIRATPGGRWRALFSTLSPTAYLFDAQWEPNDQLNKAFEASNAEITDLQIIEEPSGRAALLASTVDDGLVSVKLDGATGDVRAFQQMSASSFAVKDQAAVLVQDGRLRSHSFGVNERPAESRSRLRFDRVSNVTLGNQPSFVVTGFDGQRWQAVGCGADLAPRWTSSIGSQFFENLIDPIASTVASNASTGVGNSLPLTVAIACQEQAVHLFGPDGAWLGDVGLDGVPRGVGLLQHQSIVYLLVSVGDRVECWTWE